MSAAAKKSPHPISSDAIASSPAKKAASNPYSKAPASIPITPAATGMMATTMTSLSPSKAVVGNPYLKVASSPKTPTAAAATATVHPTPTAGSAAGIAAAAAAAKAAEAATSPTTTKPTITPEQRIKMEESRKRALERRVASLVDQEPNKKARTDAMEKAGHHGCVRCGSHDSNTLCIEWNHEGDIERERARGSGPYGWDAFRYSCCGRLAPSPCFVGKHKFRGSRYAYRPLVVQCNCHNGPARLIETKKAGPNLGRYFFRCSSDREKYCNFFMWADEAFGLPKQSRQVSDDGIKEWVNIYANPFEQQLHWMEMTASMMPTCQSILRERLVAACLMHECCSSVTGGMIDNMPHLQDLVKKVQTCFNLDDPEERKKSLLDNFLYPLNQAQVTRRFGVSFKKDDPLFMKTPTFEECRDALAKAIKENSVLRSAGVKFEVLPDTTFIQLEGLENYFRA